MFFFCVSRKWRPDSSLDFQRRGRRLRGEPGGAQEVQHQILEASRISVAGLGSRWVFGLGVSDGRLTRRFWVG